MHFPDCHTLRTSLVFRGGHDPEPSHAYCCLASVLQYLTRYRGPPLSWCVPVACFKTDGTRAREGKRCLESAIFCSRLAKSEWHESAETCLSAAAVSVLRLSALERHRVRLVRCPAGLFQPTSLRERGRGWDRLPASRLRSFPLPAGPSPGQQRFRVPGAVGQSGQARWNVSCCFYCCCPLSFDSRSGASAC